MKPKKLSTKTKTIVTSFYEYIISTKEEEPVKREEYVALCKAFNRLMMEKILNGDKIVLPEKLGTVEVLGGKDNVTVTELGEIKGLTINWKDTISYWNSNPEAKAARKPIYNTNEHSSGIRYLFRWSKRHCPIKHKTIYNLKITRDYKRALSKLIFAGREYNSK